MRRFRRDPASGNRGADSPSPNDNAIVRLVDERLGRVEEEFRAAAGGASLCAISKVAGSVPAAKYLEGRLVVLRQLRRRRPTAEEALAALQELSAEWEEELARVTRDGFGPDWRAYRAGGVDELDELAEVVATD